MIPCKYTICLADIKNDENIQNVLKSYDIYDENYRDILNNKILNHYAYDEIGFETPFLFAHYLKCRLDEIMPKYNMLYKSELLKLDPLSNFSYTEKLNKTINNDFSSNQSTSINSTDDNNITISKDVSNNFENTESFNSSSNSKSKSVFQNTPQGSISAQSIDSFNYATTMDLDGNESSQNSTNNQNSTNSIDETTNQEIKNKNIQDNSFEDISKNKNIEDYVKNITGNKDISFTKLYNEFITNFKSIDSLIINELQDLFMVIF